MAIVRSEIRPGAYHDSIVLMQLQVELVELPGIEEAAAVMGTEGNLALLAERQLAVALPPVKGEDLVIVVAAASESQATAALAQIDRLLARRAEGSAGEYRPRSLDGAVRLLPEAGWVLVSVPGRYAARVAHEGLAGGRHVFLYSDNVALEEERELKRQAAAAGLLLLGPDCGTALIGGVGLGFANRVERGPVGIVAASGTGLQAVSVRLDALGCGISHALGTGGRDLSDEIGGVSSRQALALLARDPGTEVIVLLSKPPGRETAGPLLAAAAATGKPVVVALLGQPASARRLANLHFASGLSDAAELAAQLAAEPPSGEPEAGRAEAPYLRALMSGGTLAYEALLALGPTLGRLHSNLVTVAGELAGVEPLANWQESRGHTILDLGADELTRGRAHPMLDPQLRLERLRRELLEPEVGTVLVDVVLGDGSHPDPASGLIEVIGEVGDGRRAELVVLMVGAEHDPQGLEAQIEALEGVGVRLFRDPESTWSHLLSRHLEPTSDEPWPPVPLAALAGPLVAINVGLELFHHSLCEQGASCLQVAWRPPAGGDERMMALLERMR